MLPVWWKIRFFDSNQCCFVMSELEVDVESDSRLMVQEKLSKKKKPSKSFHTCTRSVFYTFYETRAPRNWSLMESFSNPCTFRFAPNALTIGQAESTESTWQKKKVRSNKFGFGTNSLLQWGTAVVPSWLSSAWEGRVSTLSEMHWFEHFFTPSSHYLLLVEHRKFVD